MNHTASMASTTGSSVSDYPTTWCLTHLPNRSDLVLGRHGSVGRLVPGTCRELTLVAKRKGWAEHSTRKSTLDTASLRNTSYHDDETRMQRNKWETHTSTILKRSQRCDRPCTDSGAVYEQSSISRRPQQNNAFSDHADIS